MESGDDTMQTRNVRTRCMKKMEPELDEFELLSQLKDEQIEARRLLQDSMYNKFVEKVLDPNEGLIKDEPYDNKDYEPSQEYRPALGSDGSSGQDEDVSEAVEEVNETTEDAFEIDPNELKDLNEKEILFLRSLPQVQAKEYLARFPTFWRTKQNLKNHSGKAYEQEEDPDFNCEDAEEQSSSSEDEEDSEAKDDAKIKEMEEEMETLTSMVEDMIIPTEEVGGAASVVPEKNEDDNCDEDDSDVEIVAEIVPSMSDLIYGEELKDDEEIEYEPSVEIEDPDSDVSEDSYVSVNEESGDSEDDTESSDEAGDDEEEVMDE